MKGCGHIYVQKKDFNEQQERKDFFRGMGRVRYFSNGKGRSGYYNPQFLR